MLESGFEPRASASGSVFLSAAELYWFHLLDTALLAWAADQWVLSLEAAGSPQGQVCGRSFQQLVWRCPESAPVGQGRPRPGVGMRSWCSQGKVADPEELPAYLPATLFQLLAPCELSRPVRLSSGLFLED